MPAQIIVRLVCSRCGATGPEDVTDFRNEEYASKKYHRAKMEAKALGWTWDVYTEGSELCPECKMDGLLATGGERK